MAFEEIEERPELEARHGDQGRAREQALVHDHAEPVDVEEGEHGDDDVVLRERVYGLCLDEIRDQVAVAEHHPFHHPGGAARVGDRGDVRGRIDLDPGRRLGIAEEIGVGGLLARLAEDEYLDVCRLLRGCARDVEKGWSRQ
jgi:hypothetical protein